MRVVIQSFLVSFTCTGAADTCPMPMEGVTCFGDGQELGTVSSSSYDDCCNACSQNLQCNAFTFSQGSCYLQTYCRNVKTNSGGGRRRPGGTASSGVWPTNMPEKFCSGKDMYLGAGYECRDSTLQSLTVSEGECCDRCQETSGCNFYSYSTQRGQCDLKATCANKEKSIGYNTAFMPPSEPETFEFKVGQGSYTTPGFQCGDKDGTTLLFYPDGIGPFKVALYAHGLGGYLDHGTNSNLDGLDEWMKMVASVGFIVIVPFTGGGGRGCSKEYIDMLVALQYAKEHGSSLHPIFSHADWSGTGVWGHSMGAAAAPRIAEHGSEYGLNVTAMVASHGGGTSTSLVHVPSLFTTGTLDTKDVDDDGNKGAFHEDYRVCRGRPKVFVNLKGGYHMEPLEGKRLNFLTAKFLACHVQGREDFCDYIYGADGLCARNDLEACEIDTSPAPSPSPSPRPTPSPAPTPPSPVPMPSPTPMPSPIPFPTPFPTPRPPHRRRKVLVV